MSGATPVMPAMLHVSMYLIILTNIRVVSVVKVILKYWNSTTCQARQKTFL